MVRVDVQKSQQLLYDVFLQSVKEQSAEEVLATFPRLFVEYTESSAESGLPIALYTLVIADDDIRIPGVFDVSWINVDVPHGIDFGHGNTKPTEPSTCSVVCRIAIKNAHNGEPWQPDYHQHADCNPGPDRTDYRNHSVIYRLAQSG